MLQTLQDLKDEAERRVSADRLIDALKVYRLVLEAAPLDFEIRLQIGDLLVRLKATALARAVYAAIAKHNVKSGAPLRALVALKRIDQLGGDVAMLATQLVDTYAAGSTKLGRSVKQAPFDYSAKVRSDLDLDYAIDQNDLIQQVAQMAAYTENIKNYPSVVPPVPIFSTLEKTAFAKLITKLALEPYNPGDAIITQGDIGDSIYFLARGEVKVVKTMPDPETNEEKQVTLARLGPGSLFGEMALVCNDPRGASVICDTAVDALALKKADIEKLASQMTQVAGAMARFTRERMITNLLATNPVFKPFSSEEKTKLLARFTGHEVPTGTIFLEQKTAGAGLYLILNGQAEVLKWDDNQYIKVADLGPGDMVGEISLLYEEPVTATVRTTTPCTLLFLARELFKPLVDAVPDLLAYFNRLAEQRLADTEGKLTQYRVKDSIPPPPAEEILELDDDEIVFI